ncbi:hypothetical protein GQ54DRAFT_91879 [Martensiomyces pterosporus]|nr:hypothetical protein GQ54DRAFT_91879 [Martensiomyces pterosporus]
MAQPSDAAVLPVHQRPHTALSNKEKLKSYLNHRMKVSCGDGRQFVGFFKCVDQYQNVILSDTTECRKDFQRHVGMIMIPGKHVQKVLVENLEFV